MTEPKKILFLLPSLSGGGAERVVLTLLRHIDRRHFTPVLAVLQKEGRYVGQIPEGIDVIDLQISRVRYAPFRLIRLIRQLQPDIVFTTLAHLNLILAVTLPFLNRKSLFITRESNTVSVRNRDENYPRIFDWLYRHVYKNYDLIITQARYMRDDLVRNYGIDPDQIQIIYNPVDTEHIRQMSTQSKASLPAEKINLLAAGRLDYEKGFDLLLESMRYLDDRYHLTLLGEGPLLDTLQDQANRSGISEKITFAGFCDNPYTYMKGADLLVLSSRYEGLPNVVLEANALGTPVVAFASPGGTAEIIEDGLNGFTVTPFDTRSFARTVEKAISSPFDKEQIAARTAERFSISKIVGRYEESFSIT